jgi:hypothetical protein
VMPDQPDSAKIRSAWSITVAERSAWPMCHMAYLVPRRLAPAADRDLRALPAADRAAAAFLKLFALEGLRLRTHEEAVMLLQAS